MFGCKQQTITGRSFVGASFFICVPATNPLKEPICYNGSMFCIKGTETEKNNLEFLLKAVLFCFPPIFFGGMAALFIGRERR